MSSKPSPFKLINTKVIGRRLKIPPESSYDQNNELYLSVIRRIFPNGPEPSVEFNQEGISEDESSDDCASWSSGSDESPSFPEPHECQWLGCGDIDCSSCERVVECNNCSQCGINKTLQQPCLSCPDLPIHSVARHCETRCTYHTLFSKKKPEKFTVQDEYRILSGKFNDLSTSIPPRTEFSKSKDQMNTIAKEVLLPNEVQDTSKAEESVECHPTIQLPFNVKLRTSKTSETAAIINSPDITAVNTTSQLNSPPIQSNSAAEKLNQNNDSELTIYRSKDTFQCTCWISDPDLCTSRVPHIDKNTGAPCGKKHYWPCKCYLRKIPPPAISTIPLETFDVFFVKHIKECNDPECPVQRELDSLNCDYFKCRHSNENRMNSCPFKDGSLTTLPRDNQALYITNYVPGPLGAGFKRMGYMDDCSSLDKIIYFDEDYWSAYTAAMFNMIRDHQNLLIREFDEDVVGCYHQIYQYWDRNKIFIPKKILVKNTPTFIRIIETDNVALKFEAITVLYKACRTNTSLQQSLGFMKPIDHFLTIIDRDTHDGTRRMAAYCLSLATLFPPGRCIIYQIGPEAIKMLYDHYLKDDIFAMRRACMMCLSHMMEDAGVSCMISSNVTFEQTFSNLCLPDPDLILYIMKTIYYGMYDLDGRAKLTALPEFRLTPVLSGCLSKRKRLQVQSLDLLDAIVCFCKQETLMRTFKDTRGIKILNKILMKGYMVYSHPIVLKLYEELAEHPETAASIREGSLKNLIEFVNTVDDPKYIAETLKVLIKMARDPFTKEVLSLTNVLQRISALIVHTDEDIAQLVLRIFELMAAKGARSVIIQQLVLSDPMVDLLWVVGSENRGWDTRVIALRCIIALLNLSPFFGEVYIRCKNAVNPINLLCHQAKFLTTYAKTLLVQVLSTLAKSNRNYEFLIRNKAIKGILYSFKNFEGYESQLYAHSVGLLAYMLKDRRAVVQFSNVKNSFNLISKKFMERKYVSADILMNLMFLITDLTENFDVAAKAFLKNGFVKWLVVQYENCPEMGASISTAIDTIIRNYMPLKFAHFGVLDYKDRTNKIMFYVTKDMYNVYKDKFAFPMFDEGISSRLKPINPIYFINLPQWMAGDSQQNLAGDPDADKTSDNYEGYSVVSRSADSNQQQQQSKPDGATEEDEEEEPETFIPLPMDPRIPDFYVQIKRLLDMSELFEEAEYAESYESEEEMLIAKNFVDKTIEKINAIGRVVINAFIGYDRSVPVNSISQSLYLKELKANLGINVMPLGLLVMGHKFERAILFKVMADIFNLPSWLKRKKDQLAWNEVFLPTEKAALGTQMKPNYFIDLMRDEPLVIPMESPEFEEYIHEEE